MVSTSPAGVSVLWGGEGRSQVPEGVFNSGFTGCTYLYNPGLQGLRYHFSSHCDTECHHNILGNWDYKM